MEGRPREDTVRTAAESPLTTKDTKNTKKG